MQSALDAFIQLYILSNHNPSHPDNRWQRQLPDQKWDFAPPTVPELANRQKAFERSKEHLSGRCIVNVSGFKGSY
jgi:hypothetical protein